MRLLIAGWQGQVAHALMDCATRRRDVEACAVGRPALDICEVGSIERALGQIRPNVIINTAAFTSVDAAEDEPERAFALNCEGARLIATIAARRGVPVIHLSTDYVFDGTNTSAYTETDPTEPLTVYGKSKLAGEAAVRAANPKHIILRTSWVYSPYGRNFVKSTLLQARESKLLRIVGDQIGSPTYAPHLAEAILGIAARVTSAGGADVPWGVYHAAGTGTATWYDMAKEILAHLPPGKAILERIATTDYPTRALRLQNSTLDCTKLALNFRFALPEWRVGIAECVQKLAAASSY
jgi:dTDP-4-dehydrorhamnose reductase